MIASLFGNMVQCRGQDVVIEAGAVGYEVRLIGEVPVRFIDDVACFPTIERRYFIHSHHTETEGTKLYGFTAIATRDMFRKLIAIPGVGPAKACTMLDKLSVAELKEALRDHASPFSALYNVPGIGPKTVSAIIKALV